MERNNIISTQVHNPINTKAIIDGMERGPRIQCGKSTLLKHLTLLTGTSGGPL